MSKKAQMLYDPLYKQSLRRSHFDRAIHFPTEDTSTMACLTTPLM